MHTRQRRALSELLFAKPWISEKPDEIEFVESIDLNVGQSKVLASPLSFMAQQFGCAKIADSTSVVAGTGLQ
jgi:hypothetical protein